MPYNHLIISLQSRQNEGDLRRTSQLIMPYLISSWDRWMYIDIWVCHSFPTHQLPLSEII